MKGDLTREGGHQVDRSLDGFFRRVVLTALVLVIGRGTGIAMAASSGGSSSSGAAWKVRPRPWQQACPLSRSALPPVIVREIRVPVEEKKMGVEQLAVAANIHTNIFMERTSSHRRACARAAFTSPTSIARRQRCADTYKTAFSQHRCCIAREADEMYPFRIESIPQNERQPAEPGRRVRRTIW